MAEEQQFDFKPIVEEHEQLSESGIRSGNIAEVLPQILENPPIGCKDDSLKERNAAAVLQLISSVKDVKPEVLDALSSDQLDILLRYVYRGLGASENKNATFVPTSQCMFKWFDAIVKKGGDGCVVRAVCCRQAI